MAKDRGWQTGVGAFPISPKASERVEEERPRPQAINQFSLPPVDLWRGVEERGGGGQKQARIVKRPGPCSESIKVIVLSSERQGQ